MTYCPPDQPVQQHTITALSGSDLLGHGDLNLSLGDCFDMPASATVCITVSDDDTTLSGDAWRNETGDDRSWQIADIEADGVLLHSDARIYAEEYYVLQGSDGRCYYMVEIETAGSAEGDSDDFYAFIRDVPNAGVSLTITGKSNVCGNWLDYRDLSAGLKWDLDADGKLTIEAEDMALRGYRVDDVAAASGGEVIRLNKFRGEASVTFGAEGGTYDLELSYVDENDGEGEIEIWLGDTLIDKISLDQNHNGNGGNQSSISTFTLEGIDLQPGDVLTLRGTRDCWEYARIDALTFCAVLNQPPIAEDDAFTVGESEFATLNIDLNDSDPDGDALIYTLLSQPIEGTVSLNANNQIVFAPRDDFLALEDGQSATVTFDYQVFDGEFTDSATVTIHVIGEGVCIPETSTVSDTAALSSGTPVTVSLEAPEFTKDGTADLRIRASLGDEQTKYHFVYTLDISGSTGIVDSFAPGQTVLEAEIEALTILTEDILSLGLPEGSIRISIIPFNDPADLSAPVPGTGFPVFTFGDGTTGPDLTDIVQTLEDLEPLGQTNYLAAVGATSQAVLQNELQNGDTTNIVYFLSDGNPFPQTQPPQVIGGFAGFLKSQATVHSIGLLNAGLDENVRISDTTFLDPLDNSGGAVLVDDLASLSNALDAAPVDPFILSAELAITTADGTLLDSFVFTPDQFDTTPVGFELDLSGPAAITGLDRFAGQANTATLILALDENGDTVADDTVTLSAEIDGLLPLSFDFP